jgi:hypothetical protein
MTAKRYLRIDVPRNIFLRPPEAKKLRKILERALTVSYDDRIPLNHFICKIVKFLGEFEKTRADCRETMTQLFNESKEAIIQKQREREQTKREPSK